MVPHACRRTHSAEPRCLASLRTAADSRTEQLPGCQHLTSAARWPPPVCDCPACSWMAALWATCVPAWRAPWWRTCVPSRPPTWQQRSRSRRVRRPASRGHTWHKAACQPGTAAPDAVCSALPSAAKRCPGSSPTWYIPPPPFSAGAQTLPLSADEQALPSHTEIVHIPFEKGAPYPGVFVFTQVCSQAQGRSLQCVVCLCPCGQMRANQQAGFS